MNYALKKSDAVFFVSVMASFQLFLLEGFDAFFCF
jgi:hypothetical protein